MDKQITSSPDLGVIGTGRMGVRLATMFAEAGRNVILGSRDPDRAAQIAKRVELPNLRGGSHAEAIRAPRILPAVFLRDGLLQITVTVY